MLDQLRVREETLNRLRSIEQNNAEIKEQFRRIEERQQTQSVQKAQVADQETAVLKNKLQKLEDDLKLLATKEGAAKVDASFDNIEFESGSNKLTASSFSTLDQIASILKNNPAFTKLNVYGHTDNKGVALKNETLSQSRANAVKVYLLSKGVTSEISVVGYGSAKPIAPNTTPEGRKKNRRVEFQISK